MPTRVNYPTRTSQSVTPITTDERFFIETYSRKANALTDAVAQFGETSVIEGIRYAVFNVT